MKALIRMRALRLFVGAMWAVLRLQTFEMGAAHEARGSGGTARPFNRKGKGQVIGQCQKALLCQPVSGVGRSQEVAF